VAIESIQGGANGHENLVNELGGLRWGELGHLNWAAWEDTNGPRGK
jgi:hypothetical protein